MISRPYLFESLVGEGFDLGSFLAFVGFILVIGIWFWSAWPALRNAGRFFGVFEEEQSKSKIEFVTSTKSVHQDGLSGFPVRLDDTNKPTSTNYAIMSDIDQLVKTQIVEITEIIDLLVLPVSDNIAEPVLVIHATLRVEVTPTPTHYYRSYNTITPTPTSEAGSSVRIPNSWVGSTPTPDLKMTEQSMIEDNLEALLTAFP